MPQTFKTTLLKRLKTNLYNHYGEENYDAERFGPYKNGHISTLWEIKNFLKGAIGYKATAQSSAIATRFEDYYRDLDLLYRNLDEAGRHLLLDIIAYRLLGYR